MLVNARDAPPVTLRDLRETRPKDSLARLGNAGVVKSGLVIASPESTTSIRRCLCMLRTSLDARDGLGIRARNRAGCNKIQLL